MKIYFTSHAKERCEQRKISEKWVTARLLKIPLSYGTHEMMLDGTNLTIVYHDGSINRTVITLYAVIMETQQQVKKNVDLTPMRDKLDKEMKRHYRRKKQLKKPKPKKR